MDVFYFLAYLFNMDCVQWRHGC